MNEREIVSQLEADFEQGSARAAQFAALDGYYVVWTGLAFGHGAWMIHIQLEKLASDPKFRGFLVQPKTQDFPEEYADYAVLSPLDFLRRRRRGENLGLVHFFTSKVEYLFYKGMKEHLYSFLCAFEILDKPHSYVSMREERRFVRDNLEKFAKVIVDFEDETSKTMFLARLQSICALDLEHIVRNHYPVELQYFNNISPEYSFVLKESEVYIDVGASWGDCVIRFAEYVKNLDGSKIYAFEPNDKEFGTLKTLEQSLPVAASNAFVSDHSGDGFFMTNDANPLGSHMVQAGSDRDARKMVRLDDVCDRATLIKIDVEGAEPAVLRGAQRLLRDPECRLATCIYHYPADLFKTMEIMEGIGRKRFYFRQQHPSLWDGVIYYH